MTLKTAWFMGHRIREAMRIGSLVPPMGGEGSTVEVDETIFGRASPPKGRRTSAMGKAYKITNSAHKNSFYRCRAAVGARAGSTVSEVSRL